MEEEAKIEESQEEKPVPEKPLDKMTATELREIAMEIPDLEGVHAMKKEDLLAAVKKHRGIEDEAPATKKKGEGAKQPRSKPELKAKITQLRGEKKAARESKDIKKVDVLRRRINRMKKQTRKTA